MGSKQNVWNMRKVMLDQGEEVGLQWIEMLMLHYCHLVVLYDAFDICRVEDNRMKVQQTNRNSGMYVPVHLLYEDCCSVELFCSTLVNSVLLLDSPSSPVLFTLHLYNT